MLRVEHEPLVRSNNHVQLQNDVVIIGGGMAGVCAAISAARHGKKITLIQDRPVLGGNASSEVRVWILGATSHLGNNNRWSREGGIIDELLIENLFRNREGNAHIFDSILLDKVLAEKNITLLLNTAVYDIEKSSSSTISAVKAFCSQNSTDYTIEGRIFTDASGDGLVAFKAGAPFVIGEEAQCEFGEKLASVESKTDLLGHTLFFYSKDAGKPVEYTLPDFAKNTQISQERLNRVKKGEDGVKLWWIEHGGLKDTIHETEEIKYDLWSIVYTIWDHIKNSGKFKDVENLTLEWVGTIPGKRESRRFLGHYMMTQQDIVDQNQFEDAISFGGWSIDHHPSAGVFTDAAPCRQFHSKGIFQIPLRCFIPQKMDNLLLAGRIISATHIAYGSTRVMATTAHGGQAMGAAASYCIDNNLSINDLLDQQHYSAIQQMLLKDGHFLPHLPHEECNNLLSSAEILSSSQLKLKQLNFDNDYQLLNTSAAQILPLEANTKYQFSVPINVISSTKLQVELRVSDKHFNFTPNKTIEIQSFELSLGKQVLEVQFENTIDSSQYGFICFMQNDKVKIGYSKERITGIVTAFNGTNEAVSNNGRQEVDQNIGIDSFEFWCPARRPEGQNFAFTISPALEISKQLNIYNGYNRPFLGTNAWIASQCDDTPTLEVKWPEEQEITEIILHFDNDFDHPLESTLMTHPEKKMPFCIEKYKIFDDKNNLLKTVTNNYQTVNKLMFTTKIRTASLRFELENPSGTVPAALFELIIK
ncbi:FAD-dependent oxidoreductase [Shewanella sp. 202IG2-18]|uniref:FAD-dependent oxidoreductase n=1 Tax=Parashewanella hymeniacidonis TaxID=2807618 RepID=UPI00195F9D17|nr:FAD-dependent oxidoreductase [Parashewanella hymeniacidonis]MBM7072700.1 FAD-dependent oxidoreductase [Parashewanella hymeniacidonis]